MQVVDQEHEVLGRAVPAARREVPGGLVAPGPVERVLHDRQQLDVGVSERQGVLGQHWRHFAVRQQPPGVRRVASPRARRPEVDVVRRSAARSRPGQSWSQ